MNDDVKVDFIHNGAGAGEVASLLLKGGFSPADLRPYIGDDGHTEYRDVIKNGAWKAIQVHNANATLRKDEWIDLDRRVLKVRRNRLRLVNDLISRGLTYNVPNGMGTTMIQFQTESDTSDADVSMDGMRRSEADRPLYDLRSIPLPIIHKDVHFSAREIATSRKMGTPIDTTTVAQAARKVADVAEKLLLGTYGTYSFGGASVFGYCNYTYRLTKTITAPTAVGWTPGTLLAEVLEMRQQSLDNYFRGPWVLYVGPGWDLYMDDDFSPAKGDITLRERIAKIQGVGTPITVDFLPSLSMLLVQMDEDVIQEVIGMPMTTVQWGSHGGFQTNFKVMTIMVPYMRSDFNHRTGVVHASV